MTNITNIFNPPPSRDIPALEVKDCLPCQIMATVTALAAGVYFSTGMVFKNEKPGVNPMWWKHFIKGTGYGLIGFGVYRGGEHIFWGEPRGFQ